MKKLNKIVCLAAVVVAAMLTPANVHAEEKQTQVEITNEYKNGTFKLSFDEAAEVNATLISPDGSTYAFQAVSDTLYSCEIEKIITGTWTVSVSSEGDVPKYTFSLASSKDETTSVVDKSISVGKDIVGLDIYFRDRTLVISWTDTSCGNVDVRVTNLSNLEIMGNETVDDMYYELDIPDTVNNISVGVVPATSRNVDGAELVYTYEIPEAPDDVNVSFAPDEYVNSDSIMLGVTAGNEYDYSCYVNDEEVMDGHINSGEQEIQIPLGEDGTNNVVVYIIDKDGNMFSSKKMYFKDTIAPLLKMDREYDGAKTYNSSVTISGTVAEYKSLTVNGNEVPVATDGVFSYDIDLHLGDNSISVIAADDAGNVTQYDFVLVMLEKQTFSVNIPIVICSILACALVVVLVIIKKKGLFPRKKEKTQHKIMLDEDDVMVSQERKRMEKKIKTNKKEKKEQLHNKASVSGGKKENSGKHIKLIIGLIVYFAVFFYVTRVALSFSIAVSGSMEPTIETGQHSVENNFAYLKRMPERGDIITFTRSDGDTYCKRVIGIAGDSIEFHNGYVYLNGELLDESDYIDADMETNCIDTFLVPEGCVFVLGDNRENSYDSRFWEEPYVAIDDIKSKVIFLLPF